MSRPNTGELDPKDTARAEIRSYAIGFVASLLLTGGAFAAHLSGLSAPWKIALICAAPESAFNITALPKTLEVLSGGAGQPVHAMYATPDFWNIDGMPATQWTLNWAQNLIANAPQPKHG